jgi:hypothetical protein
LFEGDPEDLPDCNCQHRRGRGEERPVGHAQGQDRPVRGALP